MDWIASAFDYLSRGGIVMVFILIASIIGVSISIERYFFLTNLRRSTKKLFSIAKEKIEKGNVRDILAICDTEKTVSSNILRTAIDVYLKGLSKEEIERSIQDIAKIEMPIVNRYLYLLGTMVTVSPMLGLLGTVLGMIKATSVLAEKGLASPSELLTGIAEALITTAAGLIVAIPLLILYNYLANKSQEIIEEIEANVTEILLLMSSSKSIW
ncbi:MAG: MotA/TolQ/ExbB proton channel family protein [Spirochaetia bacterium]|nr:MotA/TolQ/ExbB proton channel family protein [Spirochaetota bacterium]MCX8096563.1 MotA/TolQ/ExbB proton channel family protein [Spirochaetota bacterium]MDW8112883.1 MotA/TolQ/ExbB proton channel family protein [Spirochaetia bacterium]